MKQPRKLTEAELQAERELAEAIGPLVPARTGYQLAQIVISALCDEIGINARDLVAIKKARKARVVRKRG